MPIQDGAMPHPGGCTPKRPGGVRAVKGGVRGRPAYIKLPQYGLQNIKPWYQLYFQVDNPIIIISIAMNANEASRSHSGLEVMLSSGPEQISPSNIHLEDKYYKDSNISEPGVVGASQRNNQILQQRPLFRPLTFWIIAILIVVCLGAALGGGLGGGLAAQRKPTSTASVRRHNNNPFLKTNMILTAPCPVTVQPTPQ